VKPLLLLVFPFLFAIALGSLSMADEAEFSFDDLDSEPARPVVKERPSSHLKFFGKVSVSTEFSPYDRKEVTTNSEFKQQHFLVFLSAQTDPKTRFMGEIVSETFYFVSHQFHSNWGLEFGKIIVPYGETDQYHHIYGGNVNFNGSGIMYPNVWAEKGFNFKYKGSSYEGDIYMVSGVTSLNGSNEPELNLPSDDSQQGGGLRFTYLMNHRSKMRASYYYTEWRPNSDLHSYGLDASYSLNLQSNWVTTVDLKAGVSLVDILDTDTSNFQKQGDYFQAKLNGLNKKSLRLRYGTYDNDSRLVDQNDKKTWSLAYIQRVRSLRFMLEHQWNLEAEDEEDNDILRFMASADF
tara:strand:- start:27056 stop:28105 length:1050 start_codon:yes stop_codon:yes gene_type:complete